MISHKLAYLPVIQGVDNVYSDKSVYPSPCNAQTIKRFQFKNLVKQVIGIAISAI